MDTSKNSDINILKYKGFDSIYENFETDRWVLKNEGYKYENSLLEDNTSSYFMNNSNMVGMFPYLNKILAHLINSVKYLRVFNNYSVKKNYKKIN
jgi:hypothetical protein